MIHAILKRETAPYHEALGRKLGFLMGRPTLTDYTALLGRFLGFYAPVEALLERLPEWGPPYDLRARRKAHLLADDLHYLGRGDGDLAGVSVCAETPALRTAAEALGCLYVLEGSTLGGRVIAPHVGRTLGLGPGRGCSYFRSYGADVGPMWAAFLHLIAGHCGHHHDDAAVVASACQTFVRLDRWLTGGV